jgi:hypothetical protein
MRPTWLALGLGLAVVTTSTAHARTLWVAVESNKKTVPQDLIAALEQPGLQVEDVAALHHALDPDHYFFKGAMRPLTISPTLSKAWDDGIAACTSIAEPRPWIAKGTPSLELCTEALKTSLWQLALDEKKPDLVVVGWFHTDKSGVNSTVNVYAPDSEQVTIISLVGGTDFDAELHKLAHLVTTAKGKPATRPVLRALPTLASDKSPELGLGQVVPLATLPALPPTCTTSLPSTLTFTVPTAVVAATFSDGYGRLGLTANDKSTRCVALTTLVCDGLAPLQAHAAGHSVDDVQRELAGNLLRAAVVRWCAQGQRAGTVAPAGAPAAPPLSPPTTSPAARPAGAP